MDAFRFPSESNDNKDHSMAHGMAFEMQFYFNFSEKCDYYMRDFFCRTQWKIKSIFKWSSIQALSFVVTIHKFWYDR